MSKFKEIVKFLSRGRAGGRDKIAYMLRSNDPDMTAHGGFVWPRRGPVTCPDWKPKAECGHGLHGLLWGEGAAHLTHGDKPAVWLVCAVWVDDVVDLGGKVKVPRAWVVRSGTRDHAVTHPRFRGRAVVYGFSSAGDHGTATAGAFGTSTAGDHGTATAGDLGTATAGHRGTATAGNYGTATAGAFGTATAGNYGTSTAGDDGTATAGAFGTSTAGDHGTATAGNYGTLRLFFWANGKDRIREAHVGEHGILPNVPYRLNDEGEFVQVTE